MAAPAALPAYYIPALPCAATPALLADASVEDNDNVSVNGEDNLQAHSSLSQDAPPVPELWAKLRPLPRGRQAGDPNAQTIRYACRNLEDLERLLALQLENQRPSSTADNGISAGTDAITNGMNAGAFASTTPDPAVVHAAEHTILEFTFGQGATFAVTDPLKQQRHVNGMLKGDAFLPSAPHSVVSVLNAMAARPTPEGETEPLLLQRAIAKSCVQGVQRADGFKYTFHNNWQSKDDGGWRFSFYCNDSLLSKGRAATGSKGTAGKVPSKPLYDCKGLVSVKFSRAKQCCEVSYRHVPIHKTYEERAPRLRRGTKRWRMLELLDPEKLPGNATKGKAETPRKRKRPSATSQSQSNGAGDNDASVGFVQELMDVMESPGPTPSRPPTGNPLMEGPNTSATERQRNPPPPISCTTCISKKVPCNGQRPCHACSACPTSCVFSDAPRQRTAAAPSESSPAPPPRTYTFVARPRGRKKTQALEEAQRQHSQTLNEMEKLRAKLAEAEGRIRRMEAERSLGTAWAQTPGGGGSSSMTGLARPALPNEMPHLPPSR